MADKSFEGNQKLKTDKFQFVEQLEKFEVYVTKKVSINLDIFFCEKLLKSIFNALTLVIGKRKVKQWI